MGDIVVDFRNALSRALKEVTDQRSYDTYSIALVQVIRRVGDRRAVTRCLDAWCALYDPAKPPTLRARLEIAKRPGRLLLLKAVELAKRNPRSGLLELVQAVMREAKAPSGPPPADRSGSKEALYGSRCAELSVEDVTAIQGAVDELVKQRATERDRTALLVDKVAAEFLRVNARAHKDLWELAEFNPGTPAQQEAFAAVAVGCEAAWRSSSQPLANAYELLDDAFAAFRRYLESEIRTPVDLFRVLAYARAPLTRPETRWDVVWEELYTEVAWRGLRLAIGRAWNVFQIQTAKGYVGQDAQLVYLPFQRSSRTARGATLLRDRLAMGARSVTGFEEFQQARRRATVTAKYGPGLSLLDEATTRLECARIRQAWKTDPKATRLRQLRVDPAADAFKQAYRINMVVPRMFTVVWADDREGYALVELEGHPGFLFRATRAGVHKLNEEHAYRLLAENAANLTQFLLFYLQVLGFAVDLISAGTAGSLGRVLIRFATDYLEDAAAEKVAKVVVDVLNIKNRGVQMAVELGAGSVPLKGLASAAGRVVDLGDAAKAARGVDVPTMGRATQRPETVQSLRPHPSQRAVRPEADNSSARAIREWLTQPRLSSRAVPRPGPVVAEVSFETARAALKEALGRAPVPASALGRLGVSSTRRGFRRGLASFLRANPGHRLAFLLENRKLRHSTPKGITIEEWREMPEIIESGHAISAKSLTGARAGTDRFMVMSAYHNRVFSSTVEHPKIEGWFELPHAIDIDGIPVHAETAVDWVAKGLLPANVLAAARPVTYP